MSGRVNDFLTCRYMVPAGSGGVRPAQEPLSEPTWALQTDLWSHETSKRPPGPILERFRTSPGGSGSPKTLCNIKFLLYFTLRHRQRPDRLNQPLGGPTMVPKRRPGTARGGLQDGSKSAPKAAQRRLPSGLGGQVGPNWHRKAVQRSFTGHF